MPAVVGVCPPSCPRLSCSPGTVLLAPLAAGPLLPPLRCQIWSSITLPKPLLVLRAGSMLSPAQRLPQPSRAGVQSLRLSPALCHLAQRGPCHREQCCWSWPGRAGWAGAGASGGSVTAGAAATRTASVCCWQIMAAVSQEREQHIINNLLKSCQGVPGPCLFLHMACPLLNAAFTGGVTSAEGGCYSPQSNSCSR